VPEVPTLKEQGLPLDITAWFALYAPAGTPPEVLGRIEKATQAAVRTPALREKLQKLGYQPVGSSGSELAAVQKADLARWERPIKTTGVQLD
jgi:tripartite-type tricarboxylate transporter receptor subunit TctC